MPAPSQQTASVTASSGSGTADVILGGMVDNVLVVAPSGAATYKWEIRDSDSKTRIHDGTQHTGDAILYPKVALAQATYTCRVFSSATDGAYTFTVTLR